MNLKSLLSWRPAFWLRLLVAYSITEAESLRAQRRIAEKNVHDAQMHLHHCRRELLKVDGAITLFDADARSAGVELARRRA